MIGSSALQLQGCGRTQDEFLYDGGSGLCLIELRKSARIQKVACHYRLSRSARMVSDSLPGIFASDFLTSSRLGAGAIAATFFLTLSMYSWSSQRSAGSETVTITR